MNDRASFLRAICADPDEVTPRLAFADWLDEHGDHADRVRATYIRADIAIHAVGVENLRCKRTNIRLWPEGLPDATAATPRQRCRCEGCSLARRHRHAAVRGHAKWRYEVVGEAVDRLVDALPSADQPVTNFAGRQINHAWLPRARFRRGFAEVLICHAATIVPLLGEVFARAPIRHVEVAGLVTHTGRGVILREWNTPTRLWELIAPAGRGELRFDHTATARQEISRRLIEHGRRERDRIWSPRPQNRG